MQASKIAQPKINDLEAISAKKFKKLKLAATKKSISQSCVGDFPREILGSYQHTGIIG
jgi:hypothetical protein